MRKREGGAAKFVLKLLLARLGVKYVAQPGGSVADAEVIDACNTYGMAWCQAFELKST